MAAELEKRHAVDEVNFSHEDDGFDLPGAAQLGGTDTDKYEMRVLGRIQQLNVRSYVHLRYRLDETCPPLTSDRPAEFSFYPYFGIRLYPDEYMGDCIDVYGPG